MPKTGRSWKSRLAVSSLILAFLWAPVAQSELKVFPMWERMSCPDIDYACYSFDQAKQILELDLDMQLKLETLKLTEAKVLDLKLSIEELKKASLLDKEVIARLDARNKEKTKELEKMTHSYIRAHERDVFGGALPWVITAVLLALGGGACLGYFTAK